MQDVLLILIISVAGPIIGSFIGVIKEPSKFFMNNMMAFSAGVMIAISFLELIPESIAIASWQACIVGFIIGAIVMYGLDKLIPHLHPDLHPRKKGNNLKRTSIYLILGIFLHNFPEGMAMAAGMHNVSFSITIAMAIAIHNIPEGICTSAPYYYCTKKKLKSFLISSSTTIPIILGYLFARFLFQNISSTGIGIITAATAGLMIYISGDELIPTSCMKHQDSWNHLAIFSLLTGIIFVIILGAIF